MGVRSALVRAGLVRPPLEPHEYEPDLRVAYRPAPGPSAARLATVVSPIAARDSAERCARRGCGRPPSDPIHGVGED